MVRKRTRAVTASQRLIDRRQAEELTGIPARSWYDLIKRGALPAVRLPHSSKLWMERADVERLIASSKETFA